MAAQQDGSAADEVRVFAGGVILAGWQEVRITRGIDQAAASFELRMARGAAAAQGPGGRVAPLVPGDAVRVHVGADLLVTGYVDTVSPKRTPDDHSIGVAGRSKTADLVDCSAVNQPGQWKGVPLATIASDIAANYDIAVLDRIGDEVLIENFEIEQGEKAFEAIERAARIQAALVHDAPDGRLVLARGQWSRAAAALVHLDGPDGEPDPDNNVIASAGRFSMAGRFSEILVKGQNKGSDANYGGPVAAVQGIASDAAVPRFRPLIVNAEGQVGPEEAERRAEWEVARRAGRALEAELTVRGWRQAAGGALWAPGMIAPVRDSSLGVFRDLLVSEVTWRLTDADGRLAVLRLQPEEAFAPKPIHPKPSGNDVLLQYDPATRRFRNPARPR